MSTKRTRPARDPGPRSAAVVRRALVRDVVTAAGCISATGNLTPEEVHETRKRIKRARATLALLRPALTEQDYVACNRALRSAGRSLAAARDATVMARTYARMRTRAGATRKRSSRGATGGATGQSKPNPTDVGRARRYLRSVAGRLAQAPLHGRGWSPLGSGLRAVYRRGRRRLPKAGSATSSEALHAWRKHAKRYWHVLERFEVLNPQRLAPAVGGARRLSELLGEEHDLAMLDQQIRGKQSAPEPDDHEVLQAVAERRAKLTPRAIKLGNRIYAEKPKAVERQMRDDWERWRER